jgi:hypothetical protein
VDKYCLWAVERNESDFEGKFDNGKALKRAFEDISRFL